MRSKGAAPPAAWPRGAGEPSARDVTHPAYRRRPVCRGVPAGSPESARLRTFSVFATASALRRAASLPSLRVAATTSTGTTADGTRELAAGNGTTAPRWTSGRTISLGAAGAAGRSTDGSAAVVTATATATAVAAPAIRGDRAADRRWAPRRPRRADLAANMAATPAPGRRAAGRRAV